MNDNFDTNIANRKPNTKIKRPIHPWDVQSTLRTTEESNKNNPVATHIEEDKKPDAPTSKSNRIKKKSFTKKPSSQKENMPKEQKHSDLSNTININSNYCKLHNDVSDHLFKLLSPSAQSVYLRLYRQSFGWNRNWAAESLPKLTSACKMSLQTVRKAIKELENIGCIKKEFSDYHKATVYRIYLPSEIGIIKSTVAYNTNINNSGLNIDTQDMGKGLLVSQFSQRSIPGDQVTDTGNSHKGDLKNLEDKDILSGGQIFNIQSIYFLGTSIYNLLDSGGALPKNISKYITDIQLMSAVNVIDEFYDSIGFSIVSRTKYRKSLIDYFEIIKSGFSADDIRYAVRWTFKNSRTRPESFSLIKHTMHLAMDDLISELKTVSGKKDLAEKKQEALKRKHNWERKEALTNFTEKDMSIWHSVINDLKESLNEHSFSAFIQPLKLIGVEGNNITISAPPDSISWVVDHFIEKIEASYLDKTEKKVTIEVR